MADAKDGDQDPERGSWFRTLYQLAHSDIRWAKEQAWRVVNWALLLLGALFTVWKYSSPWVPPLVLIALALGIVIVAIVYLLDLHNHANRSRTISDNIQRSIGNIIDGSLLGSESAGVHSRFYLTLKLVVLLVALVLFVLLVHPILDPGRTTPQQAPVAGAVPKLPN